MAPEVLVCMSRIFGKSARGGALLLGALLLVNPPTPALGAEGDAAAEQTARELRAELSRLGPSGDPDAREVLLRQIIERCPDTEEAEAAHWALADLCLDGFAEPKEEQARSVLEQFLKRYSSSRWATQVRCRLYCLCEGADAERAAQLKAELLKDKALPQVIRRSFER